MSWGRGALPPAAWRRHNQQRGAGTSSSALHTRLRHPPAHLLQGVHALVEGVHDLAGLPGEEAARARRGGAGHQGQQQQGGLHGCERGGGLLACRLPGGKAGKGWKTAATAGEGA